MKKNKKEQNYKDPIYLNFILFLSELICTIWMFSGFLISGSVNNELLSQGFDIFRFFTVDSNIYMGIIALVAAIEFKRLKNKKIKELPKSLYIWYFSGVLSVTITMIVAIFILTPLTGLYMILAESNLFLHIINPILSLLIFYRYMKSDKIDFKYTFYGLIPFYIYAIIYVTITVLHLTGVLTTGAYDWYCLFIFGMDSLYTILPLFLIATYLLSYFLWKLNKVKRIK